MDAIQRRWQTVQALCDALETVPTSEHLARLEALEPDPTLREEALAILSASRAEQEASERSRSTKPQAADLPARIGNVTITGLLGSGGSGVVYRGVRHVNGVSQPCAVKRLHAHRLSAEHQARFEREQRMLAAVAHPGVVRWLDGGFAAGAPYLTMELVEGEAITAYCDQRRLGLADRLELMSDVCEAVQSAHQQLIVHLDLKPSNILVTSGRQVKLLDFGTAKLMDETGALTATQQVTPLYASPERLRRGDVSVSCDVYSLGLVLFELLSGAWPFAARESIVAVAERASGDAVSRDLGEGVTPEAARARSLSPERLTQVLRGDLAAVCAKALAYEPKDRYRSVEQLANDIAAYRDGRPVTARKQSRAYRLERLLRRHWMATATAALVLAVLSAATVYSLRQRDVARGEALQARAANDFLTDLVGGVQWTAAGHKTTLEEFNYQALGRLNRQVAAGSLPPEMEAPLRAALANSFTSNGDAQSATDQIQRLFDLATATGSTRTRVLALSAQSELWFIQGKLKDALPPAREAYDTVRRSFNDDAGLVLSATASLAIRLSFTAGPVPEAVGLHREAVRLARIGVPADDARLVNVLSRACESLIDVTPREGLDVCHEALRIAAPLPVQGSLHNVYLALGNEASNRADWAAALDYRRKDLEIVLATAEHSNLVPVVSSLLAAAEWMSGEDRPGAMRRAATSAHAVSQSMPESAWSYAPYIVYAFLLGQAGDGAAAESWGRQAIKVADYDLDRDPRALFPHLVLAQAFLMQGKIEAARTQAERGLALAEHVRATGPFQQGLVEIRRAAAIQKPRSDGPPSR